MPIANLPNVEISFLQHAAHEEAETKRDTPILLIHGFASNQQVNWVNTQWTKVLNRAGYHVITVDNRGHGGSSKFHREEDYSLQYMAEDTVALLDYLEIKRAHLMGYSMGARITSKIAMQMPERVGKAILAGNGYGMIEPIGGADDSWETVRDGLLAESLSDVTGRRARAFRIFADQTQSDRKALACCVMGVRETFSEAQFSALQMPVLVAIGSEDDIAGSGEKLADLIPNGTFYSIEGRDHMRAVGDKAYKQAALDFLEAS